MNAAQAKRISLYSLLITMGYTPADSRKTGNELWYNSPFRKETEPSFKIKLDQNVWYDFGEGEGGNIIDFVMKYNRCDFKEALKFLDKTSVRKIKSPFIISPNRDEETLNFFDSNSPLILEIKPVYHFALKEYLKERCILPEVGFKHLQEIHYKVDEKEYFALGFANRAGGWEIRSAVFKGCLGKKDITLVETGSDKLSAFEGFIDYLSCLTLNSGKELNSDVLVLNSTSMRNYAIELVKEKKYKTIDTYFDNDAGGKSTLELFSKELPEIVIIPKNHLYETFKDYNAYLKNLSNQKLYLSSHSIL